MKISILINFVLILFCQHLFAQIPPADEDYFIYEQAEFRYIFSMVDKPNIPKVIMYNEWINKLYVDSFKWTLDEKSNLILTSPRNQTLNASATIIPNSIMTYYPGGIGSQEYFAGINWLESTLLHENAHLYQTNPKSSAVGWIKSIFGNVRWPLPPYPLFPTPNLFTPKFVIEGNATFNESRFLAGGRLYNPALLAAMYTRIKANRADVGFALNNTREFPFGSEKYILGGMFFAFLANKYSADQVNVFFVEHAHRWINPLLLNKSFNRTFGRGFFQLYKEFLATLSPVAKKQTSATGKIIATSIIPATPQIIDDQVNFITTNGIDKNTLYKVRLNGELAQSTDVNLPSGGRIFKYNSELTVASSRNYRVDGKIGKYQGLYKNNYLLLKETMGRKYIHYDANNSIYFLVNNGFTDSYFYWNDKRYDISHSDPYLSPSKNEVFYFKNEAAQKRTLFKNKQYLMSFNGFYSRLVYATDNDVFYLAASSSGSTLFKYNIPSKKNFRISKADTLIDAVKLKDKWLFVEVHADGYNMLISDEDAPIEQMPHEIHYNFHQQQEAQKFADLKQQVPQPLDTSKIKPYNSFKEMQFSQMAASFGFIQSSANQNLEFIGIVNAQFTDPTQRNSVGLMLSKHTEDRFQILTGYNNTVHQWRWSVLAAFYNDFDITNTVLAESTEIKLSFTNPWYIKGLWSSDFMVGLANRHTTDTVPYNKNSVITGVSWSYSRKFGLADLPRHSFTSSINANVGSLYNSYAFNIGDIYNLGYETYIIPSVILGRSDEEKIDISSSTMAPVSLGNFSSKTIKNKISTTELYKATLRLQKPIWWGMYFNKVPIGLKSFSPFIETSYFHFKQPASSSSEFNNFSEVIGGAEVNLVLNHDLEFKVHIFYGKNNLNNNSRFEVMSQLQTLF